MLLMLLEDRSYTRFAIGERIILGIGARLLQTVGGFRGTYTILGISRIRDAHGMEILNISGTETDN
jgi:hypothetical protein